MEYLDTKYFSYADPNDPIHRKALIRSIDLYLVNLIYTIFTENIKKILKDGIAFGMGVLIY